MRWNLRISIFIVLALATTAISYSNQNGEIFFMVSTSYAEFSSYHVSMTAVPGNDTWGGDLCLTTLYSDIDLPTTTSRDPRGINFVADASGEPPYFCYGYYLIEIGVQEQGQSGWSRRFKIDYRDADYFRIQNYHPASMSDDDILVIIESNRVVKIQRTYDNSNTEKIETASNNFGTYNIWDLKLKPSGSPNSVHHFNPFECYVDPGDDVEKRLSEQALIAAHPTTFVLSQNFPNPFNPSTEIAFAVPEASHVSIAVFDLLGKKVASIANREFSPGSYTLRWEGTDEQGRAASSGIYLCMMIAHSESGIGFTDVMKMALMK